ncbi:PUR alpha beta gamma DNA RNA binding [Schistosoma japonicum]|uniref:PUR alpha beta gamma DNA RNA binding n=2 Tax=Schistosoma japonicum TaxID=6182 RepID=C1LH88_SCHJA|nr:PUR alpha beta gamma DNA RNA binding [Schistosoma japonicum]TNN13904.1 PUR alpha beta gamma DNA RNA binding [Schistosoma japonicum]CAX74066.1 hypothetical protein [Schistosoma japonicum]
MFVRPPTIRTNRNPRRRPLPVRAPLKEINRPLLRQVVRNSRSNPCYEAYILEVREGPTVNGSTNPWISVRDNVKGNNFVGLPVSICNTLLKHLLTCATVGDEHEIDSSEDSENTCTSSPSPKIAEEISPTEVFGEGASEGETVVKKISSRVKPMFQLCMLKPIRIVCEATGCTLEVTVRNPTAKQASPSTEEPTQTVQADPERRWLISAPLEVKGNISSSGDQTLDSSDIGNTTNGNSKRQYPWETRGTLELHESLMPKLLAFLADVVTRYRAVDLIPRVPSLYSASGERRFLFNLRDTRWGKRLHISQVTDMHRNIIGIPVEALVSFRSRLDEVIKSLGLEDQYTMRSSIYKDRENRPPFRQRRLPVPPRNDSKFAGESLDRENGTQGDEENDEINSNNTQSRTRGRDRHPLRTGVFSVSNRGSRNADIYESESGPRHNIGNRFGRRGNRTNGGRERPVKRRDKNQLANGDLKASDGTNANEVNINSDIPNTPEPAVESTRMAPAAEASA